MPITDQDYIESAAILECEVNVIKTVAGVESGGSGFLPTGEVVILFEPHIFWRQLKARRINPAIILARQPEMSDVLYENWGKRPYGKPSEQWDRLRKAGTVNLEAASCSASYGKFQVMGFNHKKAGYATVFELSHYFALDESYHLKAFIAYLNTTGLKGYLKAKNWAAFAKNYNGAGYRNSPGTILDDYDYKLKTLYEKLSKHQN